MSLLQNIKVLTGKEPAVVSPPKKKIVVVEDEKPLLSILKDRLEKEGYEVHTAENGEEGLALIAAQNPRLVLLDLLMPVMDGKSMLHKLRETPGFYSLPVIVLTNAGDVENIRQTKTYNNAASFLIKSNVTMDEIVEHVKLLIG